MHPDLGIAAVGPGRQTMMARLLDLNHRAAGRGQFTECGIHDVAKVEDHRPVVRVMLVPQHARERRRADRTELYGAVTETLRDLPQCGVFERATAEFVIDDRRLISLLHLPQDLARTDVVPRHPALRGAAVTVNTAQALDRVEE